MSSVILISCIDLVPTTVLLSGIGWMFLAYSASVLNLLIPSRCNCSGSLACFSVLVNYQGNACGHLLRLLTRFNRFQRSITVKYLFCCWLSRSGRLVCHTLFFNLRLFLFLARVWFLNILRSRIIPVISGIRLDLHDPQVSPLWRYAASFLRLPLSSINGTNSCCGFWRDRFVAKGVTTTAKYSRPWYRYPSHSLRFEQPPSNCQKAQKGDQSL